MLILLLFRIMCWSVYVAQTYSSKVFNVKIRDHFCSREMQCNRVILMLMLWVSFAEQVMLVIQIDGFCRTECD